MSLLKNQLHDAIMSEDIEAVKSMLAQNANVNAKRSIDKCTPLHMAVMQKNETIVKLLLNERAKTNVRDANGNTPLQLAINSFETESDNLNIVKILIEAGGDINIRDCMKTSPLHLAAKKLDLVSIESLLDCGAFANPQDKSGFTPLYYVIKSKSRDEILKLKAAKLLLRNTNVKLNIGQTDPIIYAIEAKNVDMIKLLIHHGSNVNYKSSSQFSSPIHTALLWCANLNVIKCLLENGADVNTQDFPAMTTPLTWVMMNAKTNHTKLLELLLEYGADLDVISNNPRLFYYGRKKILRRTICQHTAKLHALDLPVNRKLSNAIVHEEDDYYLEKCLEELSEAKNTKLQNCWVSYFNILTDPKCKLVKYAGNADLVSDFENTDVKKKFPIYGETMENNMVKGIKVRKLWDNSAIKLSDNLPILNPTHLIIKDILDCFDEGDLSKLCE